MPGRSRSRKNLTRTAPFAVMIVLAWLTVPLSSREADPEPLLLAAVFTAVLAIAVLLAPWERLSTRYQALLALFGLVIIALLRHAEGGAISGYGVLVLMPVLWLALYGRRSELLILIGAVSVTFIVPILLFGEPDYPESEWRRAILMTALSAFIGLVTQGLVAQVRSRAREADQRARAEAEREAYLRAVMDSAAEGIIALDLDGVATFVNPAAARLCGYGVEELVGKRIHDLVHHSHSDGSPYPLESCPILATLRTGSEASVADEVFWRKDGSSFPVEYRATAMTVDGTVTGVVNTFTDISERLAVERMKNEFVSVVSHELRTPLTSIRGSLGLMEGGVLGELPEEAQKMLSIAISNADRLVRLINDILDAERIETGNAPMEMRPGVDLGELIAQTADLLGASAAAAGVTLDMRPVDAHLHADSDRIIQTLVNLVGNAIKFSGEGTTVTVESEVRGESVEVRVSDQGPGIPASHRESIFDRFAQVDSGGSRGKGGSGLGLAIARGIVEQHGGRIWIASEPGEPATFAFELPIETREFSLPARPPGEALDVLLLEDDADLAEVLASRLGRGGLRVSHVASLAAARKAVRSERPRLVILDVALAETGVEGLIDWLEADGWPEETAVIVYTALDLGPGDLEAFRRHGPVYTKGRVPIEELEQRVVEELAAGRGEIPSDR